MKQLLPNKFFSKYHDRDVNTFIALGLFLQDNPERRGVSGLLQGNSSYHGTFGISCSYENLMVPFQACRDCRNNLLPYLMEECFVNDPTNMLCKKCLGWSLEKLCALGKYKSQRTGKLLIVTTDHGYNLTIGPGRLTFKALKTAWAFAIEKHIDCYEWNMGNTSAYLKLFCINDDVIERFCAESKTYLNIMAALDPSSTAFFDNCERQGWLDMVALDPDIFCKPQYPAIWDLVDIQDITETPMHLGMGCQKAVLRTVLLFCSGRKKATEFARRCSSILLQLKTLHIEILPVLTFKDEKFGGYVAENYSAITMIIVWLSMVLTEPTMHPGPKDIVPDPNQKNIIEWTGKECKAWLQERGEKYAMPAAEAKEIVSQFLNGPQNKVPEIIPNHCRQLDPVCVRLLLQNLHCMWSAIMAKDTTLHYGKNRAQAVIALFLSNYESIDQRVMPNRTKQVWIAKYNILGLLRVPGHFLRHNLLRNLYEGGDIGEGMVKKLRKFCPSGVRDGWSKNMLITFYRRRAIEALHLEASNTQNRDNCTSFTKEPPKILVDANYRKFRCYKNMDDIKNLLATARPMSVIVNQHIVTNRFHFGFVFKTTKDDWYLYEVTPLQEDDIVDSWGYRYYSIQLVPNTQSIEKSPCPALTGYRFFSYAVLLPDLWTPKLATNEYHRYAFVGEDWEYLKYPDQWTRLL